MSIDFWITSRPKIDPPGFLQNYGLWIFSWQHDYKAAPRSPRINRYLEFYSISHMYGGQGWFMGEDTPEIIEMKAGDVLMIKPFYKNGCGGLQDDYIEDAISFCGPLADHMARSGILFNGVQHLGGSRRLLPIIELCRNPACEYQYRANMLLQQLLMELFLQRRQSSSEHSQKVKDLMNQIKNTPSHWWTVGEMAEFCNLSVPHFRRVFHAHTGMNPKEYILNSKIKYAANRMLSSGCSVQEAAVEAGFADPFHFSRVFKSITGLSPSGYVCQFTPVPQAGPGDRHDG
jgi:AraC-like DNA-binding protein